MGEGLGHRLVRGWGPWTECYPWIIPVGGTEADDLLKVIEMWIRYEGSPMWWAYEMVPGFEVREDEDDE